MREGEAAEAAGLLRQALAADPRDALLWRELSLVQIATGQVADGRLSLERALTLAPRDPQTLGELAQLAARRGAWGEARTLAERTAEVAPASGAVARILARCELENGNARAAEARLASWLALESPEPASRRLALKELGDVLERQGRYREAFQAFAGANRIAELQHAAAIGRSDLMGVLARLQASLDRLPAGAWPSGSVAPTSSRHVFLLGYMRSGTTLVEQALAARDDCVSLEEQDTLRAGVPILARDDGLQRLAAASEAELKPVRQDYWRRVRAFSIRPEGKLFVDKNPLNGLRLPLIRRLFPDAKIIVCLRRPADVVISCYRQAFSMNSFTYQMLDLKRATVLYDAYMRLTFGFISKLSLRPLFIRHEDMLAEPAAVLREVWRHLEIEGGEELPDVGRRARAGQVSSPSASQLRDGLWKTQSRPASAYQPELAPYAGLLRRWADRLGYDPLD